MSQPSRRLDGPNKMKGNGLVHAFQRVLDVGDVPDPGKALVEVGEEMVAVFHVGGQWFALDDICTHDGGPLADGVLCDHAIACPRHGAKFDIRTGAALTMPAVRPTRAHDVRVEEGSVWVRLRDSVSSDGPAAGFGPVADTPTSGDQAEARAVSSQSHAPAPPVASQTESTLPRPAAAAYSAGLSSPGEPAGPLSEDVVREVLREVKDPELFVNIVDLGLIYGVTIGAAPDETVGHDVSIDMTMTSPACPAGPQLIAETKRALGRRPDVANVEVRIVMDPPWTPDRMTEAARDQLGIF